MSPPPQLIERSVELWPVPSPARGMLLVKPLHPGGLQGRHLGRRVLTVLLGNACIAY